MENFDDSDIKIALSKSEIEKKNMDSLKKRTKLESLQIDEQNTNGNTEKAKSSGEFFANYIVDFIQNELHNEKYVMETLVMFSFILNNSIDTTPNSVVAYSVLNSFYDTLKIKSLELYEGLKYSISYSFYLLCSRGNANSVDYAKLFAKACGKPDDKEYIALGESFYKRFDKMISQKIISLKLI